VGSGLGDGVGVTDGVGVAVGVAVAFTVAWCVVDALVADGPGLVLAGDVQPLIDTERTRTPMQSNGTAYFSGVLMYRFIILAIGFILHPPYK
jgi:hypothetical protein